MRIWKEGFAWKGLCQVKKAIRAQKSPAISKNYSVKHKDVPPRHEGGRGVRLCNGQGQGHREDGVYRALFYLA